MLTLASPAKGISRRWIGVAEAKAGVGESDLANRIDRRRRPIGLRHRGS